MAAEASSTPSNLSINEDAHKIITECNVKTALQNDKGPDAIFTSFKVKDFTSKGDNYACFVTSVIVNYSHEGEDREVTYVVKLNPCRASSSFENFIQQIFMKEARFYTDLVPDLNAVLIKLGQPTLRVPRCYNSNYGERQEFIFLEDKRAQSFKMFDRMKGMDHDHTGIVVKELARLHAASTILVDDLGKEGFEKKYPFLYDLFLNKDDPGSHELFKTAFSGYIQNGAEIADKFKDYENMASVLKKMVPIGLDLLEQQTQCDEQFKVVCHGDCWNNNLLFRYNSDGKPEEVCLLDLQINRYGSIALDLNYMFFTSLTGDTRSEGLSTYLSSYCTTFKTVLSTAKKVMRFNQDELYKEYRTKNLFGLLMSLMVLPIVVMESTEVPDFHDLNDDNLDEKLAMLKQKVLEMIDTSPALRPRMLAMFDEMIEHKVLESVKLP